MMCPDHELLSAYTDGEVAEPWAGQLAVHLQSCTDCQAYLASLKGLSHVLQADKEPDCAPSMARVRQAIHSGPRIIELEKTPFWKKRLTVPAPLAAAAACLLLAFSTFFALNLPGPVMGVAEAPATPTVAAVNVSADDDLATIIKLMENKDFNNEVIIQLPEDSQFNFSGEPRIIRASDLNRR